MKKNKIFIACDTTNTKKINKIIKYSDTSKIFFGYKFGLEFINSKNGRKYLSKIKNKIIFLDLKLNDIPNTCVSTIRAVRDLKVNYITIHISSGLAALKAVKKVSGKTKIVGVTILTSLAQRSIKEIGYDKKLETIVSYQAKLAKRANLDAIVCSAHEVKIVKKFFRKEIITPGIRFNSNSNDQQRVMSPKNAFQNGSEWLVMGRPITQGNIKLNIEKLINHLKND